MHKFWCMHKHIHVYNYVVCLELISGANLTVRASKIISGQEPTKTNELLQAIGKALDKKVIYLVVYIKISLRINRKYLYL